MYRIIPRKYNRGHKALLAEDIHMQLNTDQAACFERVVTAITEDLQIAHFYL